MMMETIPREVNVTVIVGDDGDGEVDLMKKSLVIMQMMMKTKIMANVKITADGIRKMMLALRTMKSSP